MRILPFGDSAVLAEFSSLDEVRGAARALTSAPPPGVLDVVPAARTVLVRIRPAELPLAAAERWIREVAQAPPPDDAAGEVVVLPVRYDGPDLADTARLLGIEAGELVRRHTAAEWECAFSGFAPGFAYLVSPGLDLAVPRLPTSRPRVPAGAVAVAGEFSGVYPRESPGGWRLLGTTDAVLWDETRTAPALLPPGARVRFEALP
ncbi:allophanate hydrolase subunit 1 [Naasia sp. SYSU D00057]|uniref:5-oxoprolinase subunit B family protein n=1 Tax=Naasia sp. SYSU D00057 TaxID=2817380 RepID=UPI001B306B14|nr:allophanate hydrolase subunit 1 [Naasia sp. SYSU D00057]